MSRLAFQDPAFHLTVCLFTCTLWGLPWFFSSPNLANWLTKITWAELTGWLEAPGLERLCREMTSDLLFFWGFFTRHIHKWTLHRHIPITLCVCVSTDIYLYVIYRKKTLKKTDVCFPHHSLHSSHRPFFPYPRNHFPSHQYRKTRGTSTSPIQNKRKKKISWIDGSFHEK